MESCWVRLSARQWLLCLRAAQQGRVAYLTGDLEGLRLLEWRLERSRDLEGCLREGDRDLSRLDLSLERER